MTDDDDLRAEVRELRSKVDALQHRLGRLESILDSETLPEEHRTRERDLDRTYARLFGGIPGLVRYPNAAVVGVFIGVIALLFATGQVWSVAGPLAVAAVVVPFGLSSTDHWLRYAGVEYRVDGDAIVAHDRLFRQPLWRVEPWDERSLRVERD